MTQRDCSNRQVLHLAITYHWYDETVEGLKRVEYRNMTDHWRKYRQITVDSWCSLSLAINCLAHSEIHSLEERFIR